jgi:hypothetical protein
LARVACELGSAIGAEAVLLANRLVLPVSVPICCEALSLSV